MYRVWMIFDDNSTKPYGAYASREEAEKVASKIVAEQNCQTEVEVMRL